MDKIDLQGVTLRVNTGLAEEIGLNESVVLLQIEWWIRHSDNVRDDRKWTYQSLENMREKAFPFWSKRTLNRAIKNLIVRGLIVEGNYNRHKYDRTRWFSLECDAIDALVSVNLSTWKVTERHMQVDKTPHASGQNATTIPETPHKESSKEYNRDKVIDFPIGSDKPYSGGVGGDDSDKEHPLKENDLKALIKEYGRVEVDDAVGRAMEQQARKSNVRNIGAYVRVILRNERMNGKVDANPLVRSMNVNPPEREEIPSPQPPPRFAKRGSEKPADVSVEAAAWMAAYGQLELILDSENFNTWLRDCEFVGADDGVYVVQAKNSYARDMLQHRLYRNVRRVLSDVLGAEVELKFVVSGEAVAS